MIIILEGLPEEYSAHKDHLLNQSEITLDDAQQILASEEARIKSDLEVGQKEDTTLFVRNQRRPMSEVDCHNCGKLGHFAKDCRMRRSDGNKRSYEKDNRPYERREAANNSHESNKRPRQRAAVMAEYNSNEDSDEEPARAGSGQLNMLASSRANPYN